MTAKKLQKLAVFDIDGTIFRSSLAVELIRGLVEDGVFPASAKRKMEKDYVAWVNRVGSYETFTQTVIKIFLKHVKDKRQADVERAMRAIVKKHSQRLYRYTRDLIKELQNKNYFLLAISNSPTYIVSEFAKALGFQAFYGSVYIVENGHYTGQAFSNFNNAKDKAGVLLSFLETTAQQFDLQSAIAVGDTESDIPMLSKVGNPIAFNPNDKLAAHAKKKQWTIIVERKNVIYRLNQFKFLQHN